MNIKLFSKDVNNISGIVTPPGSKSEAHRVLILSALCSEPTEMTFGDLCDDVSATIDCIQELGCKVLSDKGKITVTPNIQKTKRKFIFDCKESGSTLRFMLPVASALGLESVFIGSGLLPMRPVGPLIEAMEMHGIVFSSKTLPIEIRGQLQPGKFFLPGDISSQFLTGLLLALPTLKNDSRVILTSPLNSEPYIDLTIKILRSFGVHVIKENETIDIVGTDNIISPGKIKISTDWSSAAFWCCMGALSDKGIAIEGLNTDSTQGDKKIIDILKRLGADIQTSDSKIYIKKGSIAGTFIDASDIPDLVPIISSFAVFADGKTVITNIDRLKYKESNRIESIRDIISNFGGNIYTEKDKIIITGGFNNKDDIVLNSHNDHRIAMASALLAYGKDVTILGADSVNKSYPNLWRDLRRLI